jgi:hypothetical protein
MVPMPSFLRSGLRDAAAAARVCGLSGARRIRCARPTNKAGDYVKRAPGARQQRGLHPGHVECAKSASLQAGSIREGVWRFCGPILLQAHQNLASEISLLRRAALDLGQIQRKQRFLAAGEAD